MDFKSPFSDAIEKSPVPTRGSASGDYNAQTIPGVPSGDAGIVPELYFDTHFGDPKISGPITDCPFKDRVGK